MTSETARDPATGGLADGLVGLSVLIQSVFTDVAQQHGLTPAHARLLCELAAGPRGMTELATALGVEKAALTGLADRAEQRGLIERHAVPGDRRALCVALTTSGRGAATAFHRDVSASLESLADVLLPAERGTFARSLARVTSGFARPGLAPGRSA